MQSAPQTNDIAAIILAAGASTRMGQPKQLLDWHGEPLVRRVAMNALGAVARVVVVVGGAGGAVAEALAGLPVQVVANPRYAEGQSTSLGAGIAALDAGVAAALVLLGDQPFVESAVIERIVREWRASAAPIVAPIYDGQRGHPVLFARVVFPELLAVRGDQGARTLLAADPARVRAVHFADARPLADLDTPADYEQLRHPSHGAHNNG